MPQADEIELPAHMRQGFALAAEALKRYPIPQAMLGGGTVLAALWNHRDSTDLDFAVPRSVVEGLLRVLDSMSDDFRIMAAKAYLDAPPDLHKRDRKPIINPRFDVPMHGLPQVAGQAIMEVGLSAIPEMHRIGSEHSPSQGPGS